MNLLPKVVELQTLADPAAQILAACDHTKTWLSQALNNNTTKEISEFKARAAGICEYAKQQKRIGKTAELSATEIVRRAERCLALAIRKGQAKGIIAKPGQGGGKSPRAKRDRSDRGISLPTDFASSSELSGNDAGIYAMSDDVTNEQFEAGIEKAKEEGNLSRANVVRKVKPNGKPKPKAKTKPKGNGKADRWARIPELAAEGYTSHQIAKKIGAHRDTVARKAAEMGIAIHADQVVGRSRLVRSERVIKSIVDTLDSLAPSCDMVDLAQVDRKALAECLAIMNGAMKALGAFQRRLKKEVENDS